MVTTCAELRVPSWLPAVIPQGNRDAMLYRLACAYRARGADGQILFEAVQRENQARCVPPLPEHTVWAKVRSASRHEPGRSQPNNAYGRVRHAGKKPNRRPSKNWRSRLEAPSEAWQKAARAFVSYAQAQLWETPRALKYLHDRGLSDDTIRRASLGWNPKDDWRRPGKRWGLPKREVKLWGGWVIPNESGGTLWGVNVRRPGHPEPKYKCITGSQRKVYGLDWAGRQSDLVIVEGEFDALLLAQEVPAIVAVLALGGAENMPDVESLRILAGFRRW